MSRNETTDVCFALENKGATELSALSASFQPRLDFTVVRSPQVPDRLTAGASARLRYGLHAPERINLSTQYNRESYAQWSATMQSPAGPRMAHAWVKIEMQQP